VIYNPDWQAVKISGLAWRFHGLLNQANTHHNQAAISDIPYCDTGDWL
jgi:hypothetical protein